ncbi:MAG TPA: adenylate/guanylate cyclase domain-containing protein [Actinomycetota bacterium]|nr:adenylate/guanylate cyclase domain-containing protein [Actinomycetota bacterium]
MPVRVRVIRSHCVGAGNCIYVAPTAFAWQKGEWHGKADVLDPTSVEEERLFEAALACPTQAIEIEEVDEMLPLHTGLTRTVATARVERTFMFTDIARSTVLVEALGDKAWESLISWHDQTLRSLFAAHGGEEIQHTGDGFFVAFPDQASALDAAVAIQRRLEEHRRTQGFAPEVRIGLHASAATRIERDFRGKGVHEAARIAALGEGGEIVTSRSTAEGTTYPVSEPRSVTLKGISEPIEVVTVDWR